MEQTTLIEGRPSLGAALSVATVGFLLLGLITAAVFVWTESLQLRDYLIGGLSGTLAALVYPWQILDTRGRVHRLTNTSLIYKAGILTRFEIEIPYEHLQSVSVRQGILQRLFGVGDVIVSGLAISAPHSFVVTQRDLNMLRIKSVPDFRELSELLRERLGAGA